ncbi:MAG TPA: NADH-quinone oxidoreductase subunit N [Acidimicrobiales bacterium]|nr:NADH-quinone oxidoreductase subunit N [Acidimicrobiales bacterium]
MIALLAQAGGFTAPTIDYHAFAPEIVLTGVLVVVLLADLVFERDKWLIPSLTGIGVLAALVPVLTLALDGTDRVMFDGAYVVDDFALVMKALFLIAGYVVILLSTNYIAEGDYHEGEYYFLLLSSLLGMSVMASARDLISIFVALELLSIPAYMLAAWRKRDLKGNEAGLKYYLMGVFASAVLLYGMSLLYGVTGSTLLTEIGAQIGAKPSSVPFITLGILFIIVGFGFKVSAVPFHTWAPDTYEGAPTPIASFLAVASKAAGFVALLSLVFLAFPGRSDVVEPLMWILAAVTMTVGNLIALRQTNIVRLLAYSSVAQAGFMLAPLAVVGDAGQEALTAVVVYLLIYTAMNLGAFAVVIAVARRTGSGEIDSYRGLFQYSPALAVLMSVFLFALAGIPPLAGWVAKFVVFRALLSAETVSGAVLAVVVAVNSVIALFYYANVARLMWFQDAPEGETTSIRVPFSLSAALGIAVIGTLVFGIFPGLVTHFGDAANLAASAIP